MFEPIIASFGIALLSFIGAFFIGPKGVGNKAHRYIIPVAVGVFLGVIFFELIPETLHGSEFYGAVAIVGGFIAFYLLSYFLRTFHVHEDDEHSHVGTRSAKMLLIGDGVHNIADGVVIVGAFLVSPTVGLAVTFGIALHEIAQEVAEYAVLISAGYSRKKALLYNFLSASSIFIGVIVASAFVHFGDYIWVLTGVAAGNLLYIVASDMIPELNNDAHRRHFTQTFISTLLGLVVIVALITWTHENTRQDEHEEEITEEISHT